MSQALTHAAAHAAHSHAEEFGAHGHKGHGHVIVNIWTLRAVLAALLFFTLATVGAALLEQWVSATFNVVIPQWINVFVALSIAAVKTTLVVTFFMQLKYDNPLNTMIFVFTVLTVAFFLGFTGLDMDNRATIDRFKNGYIHAGGNVSMGGAFAPPADPELEAAAKAGSKLPDGQPYTYTNIKAGESLVDRAIRLDAERRALGLPEVHVSHARHHTNPELLSNITESGYRNPIPEIGSSSERSRPVTGLTLPGLAPAGQAKAPDAHAPEHH